ncbi:MULTISPECIES: hypothetical protein [Citrobacter]|uniref:hypothetical protein n=1 Tax=Citrobacter TaxID=544 RepID=UPI001903EA27|nr:MULTISPECIES: hypothetical protein [Citrobacter]MBJ9122239.1 hypothetical protein [Citrobacter koseri]MDM3067017.1 hypothetical protein [Citrobacter sp. CK180]HEM6718674.1 hypothetical protein [Citrobacter koseri]
MMSMDNMIIAGVRIYFPPGTALPAPTLELRTFAIISKDLPGHLVLEYKNRQWVPVLTRLFDDSAHAISAITSLSKKTWH